MKRRRGTPDAEGRIALEMPALKRSVDLGSEFTTLRCDGRAFPELPHTSFACTVSGETELHTDLCSAHEALVVRHRTYGYFEPRQASEERVELPYGVRLRLT